jgi:3-oxoacyl-[acyl-carrier protein] reductase
VQHADAPPVVLVTGAAGAIGTATVSAMHEAGFAVVGFDRAAAPSDTRCLHVEVDVTNHAALAEAVSSMRPTGRLAHVVGIAGGALPGEPETQDDPTAIDPTLFRASLEANLTSQFLVVRAALPWLRETTLDRSITLTSSFNALSGQGMPAYSAAKAGLIGLMRALVVPLGRHGIRINVVAPGTVRTPRTERLWQGTPGHFERLEQGTALGRLGEPVDVAEAFVSLTRMRHVTGHVLIVDGGQTVVGH